VSIKSKNNKQFLNDIERELFVNILDMYNFEDIFDSEKSKDTFLQFSEIFGSNPKSEVENPFGILEKMHYNSPDDMFLSINNKTFVHHKSLEDKNKTQTKITSFGLDEFSEIQNGKEIKIRKINETKTREQSSGLYKNFTTNDNIKNMKKIFISYAKENLNSVHDFEKQIAPFKLSGEVQTWYCSNLELGEDWENKISTKFYEADIILYFISTDFFSTPFILDFEIVNGIKRYDDPNDKVIIIPIILEKIHWSGLLGKYNSNFKGYPLSLIENPNNFWFEVVDDLTKHFQPQNENSTIGKLGISKEKMKTHENIIKGEL
jgi:internalin A